MHSLRSKITTLTALITVLSVAVVTTLSVIFIRNTERQKSDQLLLVLCETGEQVLDYVFRGVEKSVQDVASYTEEDLDGLGEEQLREHMERVRSYFEIAASKTGGVLTYYYRIDPSVSDTVRGFWYTSMDGLSFQEHEVTDITQYDTEDTSALVWFTVPKRTGTPIWLPPYITENLGARVISYNFPIYWQERFVGVIGMEIDYALLAERVESLRLFQNGYAFLTDADGTLLFHPRYDLTRPAEEEVPRPPENLISDSTFTFYTFEGVRKEAAWLGLRNGMRLYVSVPEEEMEGNLRPLIRNVLIASAAVLVISLLLARWFARKITRPLEQLTEAARQADEGNYDFNLTYHGRDEVGKLTGTFTRMAAHMKEQISALNRRAYVDTLTSIRNKAAYTDYMDELQSRLEADPESMEYAVGVFDCNNLKLINDGHGHDKGDAYLQTASRFICRVFSHSPVFRIGGDEFAAFLINEDYENRTALIETFKKKAAEKNAKAVHPWEKIHIALGIAEYDSSLDRSVLDTVRRADKMMYINKRKYKKAAE